MLIPYGRQAIDDDDIAAVVEVLRGDWLTQGPAVAAFEETLAGACDVPHAVAFSSGTAALHAAAYAAGVGAGDEIVTSSITFAASANCGAYLGATPRFADISPSTWNVTPESVAAVTTAKTKLVVPVHFAGLPLDVRALRESLPPSVRIVEDAAHALGAHSGGEPVGSCRYSDMAVFSFHPVKAVTSGEGGMVTTRDPELAETLRMFRTHGLTKRPERLLRTEGGWHQEQQLLGFNYRLTDLQCALGASQMQKLARFVARRNEIADQYREELADCSELELAPAAAPGSRHAYHLFVVRHRGGAEARRRLYDMLHERRVLAQVHYMPVYLHPYYRETFGYEQGLCAEAERYYAGCISLPCFPTLSDEQQATVVAAIREITE